MKKEIHPGNYRLVAFKDLNNGKVFLTMSTAPAEDKITIEGTEYPLVNIHISSSSHPFFTGEERIVDVEGRVDKFKARVAAGNAARASLMSSQKKEKVPKKKEVTVS